MFLCATIPMTDLKVLHLEADPYEDKTKQNKTKSQSRVQAPSRELLALCLGVLGAYVCISVRTYVSKHAD